ncbi:2-polyprenyl-6-methoxyphenol hydroxylase-like FAD-dependent oxidoreductase [Prauserella isguenensis]|uniref:2-polyprenyl-6-methoxyphenol hydroxylase-like FAD-dependent oxidoreductase n=1 Tax=Prauserella isguenensis TaxID=1470180 RepID=A0A839RVV9_9PSEU|nr:FAD-dependent oxidoreductase [Prauserella isguenensis]MBB3049546.1 2-polyprenyl-6-methoxyphenol hydroxylase-like FAD-dependent oxidoreductase [Prauserella isguenensis]
MAEHAVVVGGGIAGLATAAALRRRSWQVTVLERKPSISEVGAGITLWPNALRALDALGLGERIRRLGLVQASGGIRDSRGRWLTRTDTDALAARFGDGIVIVERGELLTTLREACRDVRIRTSAEVRAVDADGADPDKAVILGNGESVRGDVVIGADGVGSAVRGSLWPRARVRSTGMLAARFIGRLADPGDVEGGESWGRGDYAGLAPLPDGRLYVFLVVPVASGVPSGPGEALPWLRHRFSSWHDPLPRLLASVEPSQLLINELADLAPLRTLVHGRTVLVGDAAHAMTPNLGQGACQALEDSVELASALAAGADRDPAQRLRVYDRRRLHRVHRLARRSRSAGRAAGMRGRITTTVRNALVGAVPEALTLRAFDATLDWTPP